MDGLGVSGTRRALAGRVGEPQLAHHGRRTRGRPHVPAHHRSGARPPALVMRPLSGRLHMPLSVTHGVPTLFIPPRRVRACRSQSRHARRADSGSPMPSSRWTAISWRSGPIYDVDALGGPGGRPRRSRARLLRRLLRAERQLAGVARRSSCVPAAEGPLRVLREHLGAVRPESEDRGAAARASCTGSTSSCGTWVAAGSTRATRTRSVTASQLGHRSPSGSR